MRRWWTATLERPAQPVPAARQVWADVGPGYAANGFIGWVFAATAPVAIILSVGSAGGLNERQLASWIFGVFFVNGLISLLLCWRYRAPLGFAWTIPGTVLVGPALSHLSFAEVVGAFHATGALVLLLGATGWVRQAMRAVPMPIVMGMVAGVFLRFGLDLVRALHLDPGVAVPMVVAWVLLMAVPRWGRWLPPMIGALLVGVVAVAVLGRMQGASLGVVELARPVFQRPVWTLAALAELVLPLAITVLVVQNGQGIAVLRSAGHDPPVNVLTVASGIGAIASAAVGAVSSCLTGPTNAILVSSGERARQYTAGLTFGLLCVVFGLLSPVFTRLMLQAPPAFIAALAGLAMLRVLQSAFVAAFRERFALGALVAMLVTVADLGLWNIGAAFWGLLAGLGISALLERGDFAAARAER
jgi:benzoate membrane transport protein